MYIAEQQLVAAAVGLQVRGWTPFASTFAAFLSRAYDFVRMAAISQANLRLSGSHAGVSIGEDGPSQMALEDLAVDARGPRLDRALPVRRQPDREARRGDGRPRRASPTSARRAASTPVLYGAGRGRSRSAAARVVRAVGDDVTLVGAGITLHEALEGRRRRSRARASHARVIDLYSVKPIDADDAARRRPRRPAAGSSSSRTTGPRAASATRCSRRSPTRTTARACVKLAVREMPRLGQAGRAAARAPASTRTRSPRPRASSSRRPPSRGDARGAAPPRAAGRLGACALRLRRRREDERHAACDRQVQRRHRAGPPARVRRRRTGRVTTCRVAPGAGRDGELCWSPLTESDRLAPGDRPRRAARDRPGHHDRRRVSRSQPARGAEGARRRLRRPREYGTVALA